MAKPFRCVRGGRSEGMGFRWFSRVQRAASAELAVKGYLASIADYVDPTRARRRTLVKWSLTRSRQTSFGSPRWILCDANAGKATSVHELLGITLAVANPAQCPRSVRLRLIALFCSLYPERRRDVALAQLHSRCFVEWRLKYVPESEVFVWNPSGLMHYAVAFREARVAVYHLNCAYPKLPHARWVFGSALSLEVLSYNSNVSLVVVGPRLAVVDEKPRVVLCPSKLAVADRVGTEQFLLELGEWIRVKFGFPVWVFFHPNDRRAIVDSSFLRGRMQSQGLILSEDEYESRVSHSDVSLSALSTIGTELTSRGLAHQVLVSGMPHVAEMRGDWRCRAGAILSARGSALNIRPGLEACASEVVSLLAHKRMTDRFRSSGVRGPN